MKTLRKLSPVVMAILAALCMSTCSYLGVDIQDRVSSFVISLNNPDRSTINANFDQLLTQNLPTMTTSWWAAFFPVPQDANHQYFVTLTDYSDPSNVTGTIMGPPAFTNGTGLPLNAVFVMSREGMDWYIEKLSLNGSSTPIIQ